MYTDCPGCHRQFHVYAAQLSAAGGMVKCGYCGCKFNALDRLRDQPLARSELDPPVISETQQPVEPEFVIPEPSENLPEQTENPPEQEVIIQGQDAEQGNQELAEVNAPSQVQDEPDEKPAARQVTARKPSASASAARRDRFNYSEALLAEPVRKSGWLSRILWGFGILLLIVFGSGQLIWFNRDTIMQRYPETTDWFHRFCEKFECEVIRHRDPGAIKLLNRDVREHPRYKNALLVNATMVNRSQTVQAYPVVQLDLFNIDGKIIAYRSFQPNEYLDDSINILRGMRPGVPVHFVLEVLDSAKGAVSFEFEFH